MVGPKRGIGSPWALGSGAVACLVWGASACSAGHGAEGPSDALGGSSSLAGGGSSGSGISIGSGGSVEPCQPPQIQSPLFAAQVFNSQTPARRELYSWTTDEQAAALRADHVLFTNVEAKGLGPGYAFTRLQELAQGGASSTEEAQLAALLGGELFAKKRYAWPEPWATRRGWPGEDYGGRLLRIVLKPEAWFVVVKDDRLSVFDQNHLPVTIADALATPRRLGAIFYQRSGSEGGPRCGGSFRSGANGYREFILGNLEMVEEWSLGTPTIRDRLLENIARLKSFLEEIRNCPSTVGPTTWNLDVVCQWDRPFAFPVSESFAYEQSLAIPSANYLPVPEQLAQIIATLEGDLFDPDPLVVTPGNP